jgi:membrane-bound metal-dependent hydrolase YbcI (DUF457 family)
VFEKQRFFTTKPKKFEHTKFKISFLIKLWALKFYMVLNRCLIDCFYIQKFAFFWFLGSNFFFTKLALNSFPSGIQKKIITLGCFFSYLKFKIFKFQKRIKTCRERVDSKKGRVVRWSKWNVLHNKQKGKLRKLTFIFHSEMC